MAAIFGDPLPDRTRDEMPDEMRDEMGPERAEEGTRDDDWLRAQVPPHHG